MGRLMQNLRTDDFSNLHPVVQSAYAHYAFVRIHPFADGNGRVARTLASVYLMKESYIPLIIFSDQRDAYIDALEAADEGDFQLFSDFIFQRGIGAMELVKQFADSARFPDPKDTLAAISKLYIAHSGLGHLELDSLGQQLFRLAKTALETEGDKRIKGLVKFGTNSGSHGVDTNLIPNGFRPLVGDTVPYFSIKASTDQPARANVSMAFRTFVAKSEATDGIAIVSDEAGIHQLRASLSDLKSSPQGSTEFFIKMNAWAAGVIGNLLGRVAGEAE